MVVPLLEQPKGMNDVNTDPNRIVAMAGAVAWMLVLVIYLPIVRAWTRRLAAKRNHIAHAEKPQITWSIVSAMIWRLGLISGIPGLFYLLGSESPQEVGKAIGTGLALAFVLWIFGLLSSWQHARRFSAGALSVPAEDNEEATKQNQLIGIARVFDQAPSRFSQPPPLNLSRRQVEAGLNHWRQIPTVVEGVAICWWLIFLASIFIPAFAIAKKQPALAENAEARQQARDLSHASIDELLSAAKATDSQQPPKNDVTFPIREEARKMADILKASGLSDEHAEHVALRKMPGGSTVDWWQSEFLPRFAPKDRSVIFEQLQRYQEVSNRHSDKVVEIDFAERVVVAMLQQKLKLSHRECFAIWQAGLSKQSEEWWNGYLVRLPAEDSSRFNKLRETITQNVVSAPPSSRDAASFSHSVRPQRKYSNRTQTVIAQWNKMNPDSPASQALCDSMQTVEDAMTLFFTTGASIDPSEILNGDPSDAQVAQKLHTLQRSAGALSLAIEGHKQQVQKDLKETDLTAAEQKQVLTNTVDGYKRLIKSVSAAREAASAGLTLRESLIRRQKTDSAEERFFTTWESFVSAQQALQEKAADVQRKTDRILRE